MAGFLELLGRTSLQPEAVRFNQQDGRSPYRGVSERAIPARLEAWDLGIVGLKEAPHDHYTMRWNKTVCLTMGTMGYGSRP